MYPRLCLGLLLVFLSSLSLAALSDERSVDIFAWPLSASKPQSFLKISYTSQNATIKSHKTPQIPANEEVVRVGFNLPSGDWTGVATAASNFAPGKSQRLQLRVKSDGELYHVGFRVADGVSQGSEGNTKDGVSVVVVAISPGPAPQLNKPVVVNPDGNVESKEPEQSFFQKYWWAIALFVVMQLVVGGGGKEEKKE